MLSIHKITPPLALFTVHWDQLPDGSGFTLSHLPRRGDFAQRSADPTVLSYSYLLPGNCRSLIPNIRAASITSAHHETFSALPRYVSHLASSGVVIAELKSKGVEMEKVGRTPSRCSPARRTRQRFSLLCLALHHNSLLASGSTLLRLKRRATLFSRDSRGKIIKGTFIIGRNWLSRSKSNMSKVLYVKSTSVFRLKSQE